MNKFTIVPINNDSINKYLEYKNLDINRKYSSNKKKISRIEHYLWWLTNQKKRKSFFILKNEKKLFISTADEFKVGRTRLLYLGLISCTDEVDLFDFLKAVKAQGESLHELKNSFCFISIDPQNRAIASHWKYFKYLKLERKNKLFNMIKKCVVINSKFNIYYKKII